VVLSVLAAAAALAAPVPQGDFLVTDLSGAVRVVDGRGRTLRRLAWRLPRQQPQSAELAPDRRTAFVSLWRNELPPDLVKVDLRNGGRRLLAHGVSPAVSPDQTRVAFLVAGRENEINYVTALAVRNLRTSRTRIIPIEPRLALGTPPELVTNWSPDARHLALYNGTQVFVVDTRRAVTIPSRQPVGTASLFAPVFLTRALLVTEAGCCIGPQRLVVVDPSLQLRYPFATVSSPVEHVRRIGPGRLLVVTALNELTVVTSGHVRVLAHRVVSAAP
jgi:hypothetical protein